MSVGDLASVGTAESFSWPSQAVGLSEQARGTVPATPTQNLLSNPLFDPAAVSSVTNQVAGTSSSTVPQFNVTADAIGSHTSPSVDPHSGDGWPADKPPIVDPFGTVGWHIGLSGQARGIAQANVTGVVRPTVESSRLPGVITQQPLSTVLSPAAGAAAVAPASTAAADKLKERTTLRLLKLNQFNGEGSLETFLAKFRNMSQYLGWNEMDRFHHLCASLSGSAGQVLWNVPSNATADYVIELLRTRFGNEIRIEQYRAEVRARRRPPNEMLQSLYLDIVRMTTLAHPNGDVGLTQHVAKEAFINALNDNDLQVDVIDKQPVTVEEVLSIAIRLDAYKAALKLLEAPPAEVSKGEVATEHRTVNTIRSSGSDTEYELQMELRALQQEFDDYKSQVSFRDPPTPRSSPRKPARSPRANVPPESGRQGITARQTKGQGKRGGQS